MSTTSSGGIPTARSSSVSTMRPATRDIPLQSVIGEHPICIHLPPSLLAIQRNTCWDLSVEPPVMPRIGTANDCAKFLRGVLTRYYCENKPMCEAIFARLESWNKDIAWQLLANENAMKLELGLGNNPGIFLHQEVRRQSKKVSDLKFSFYYFHSKYYVQDAL